MTQILETEFLKHLTFPNREFGNEAYFGEGSPNPLFLHPLEDYSLGLPDSECQHNVCFHKVSEFRNQVGINYHFHETKNTP